MSSLCKGRWVVVWGFRPLGEIFRCVFVSARFHITRNNILAFCTDNIVSCTQIPLIQKRLLVYELHFTLVLVLYWSPFCSPDLVSLCKQIVVNTLLEPV
jgi:hypothetical protein